MSQEQKQFPAQQQQPHGSEAKMTPRPETKGHEYRASGKLQNRVALITGGDSGIGHAVAVLFAKEGADVAIVYLDAHEDAKRAAHDVEEAGRRCLLIAGDVGDEQFCQHAVQQTISTFGKLDILVNNAGEQHVKSSVEEISSEQLERTFRTNIFSQFYMTKAALRHLKAGSAIVNTTSVTAYQGAPQLLDYSATKGAIVAFTRSLSKGLAEKGIRVNAVAPGPIWTPLIPSTFPPQQVESFGSDVPLKRAGQPEEVAPAYVYLASDDASYMTGQVLHVNGGTIVNG
uniref:NAD(P)-dependent oxidoreductase n=1 Tax=Thermosporothrix sp. COM3 TaxID=2490863 RepID=A0A455SHB5_9CHLR|nr:NAD(P)-dependent oxidoreductase [Thermosporothrix sp. COM3]